jgi:hypothetical protein
MGPHRQSGGKRRTGQRLHCGYSAIIDSGVFQKAYPKIRIVSVTGSGTDLATRLASERRAGKYIADVYSAPAIKLLDELLPAKK